VGSALLVCWAGLLVLVSKRTVSTA